MTARRATDAYLVTGNKKHFPIKSFVVTPREMLDIIGDKAIRNVWVDGEKEGTYK